MIAGSGGGFAHRAQRIWKKFVLIFRGLRNFELRDCQFLLVQCTNGAAGKMRELC
jgi:hypothetical protein